MTVQSAPITIPAIAQDGTLFPIEKMKAHELGQLHVAISAFVFNAEGQLLIQQRAKHKYHCGGQWANTCCSHPHWGESVSDCAHRRLGEELGVSLPLTPIGEVTYRADVGGGLTEHEHVHMFSGTADAANWKPKPNPDEVDQTRWVSMGWLQDQLVTSPESLTPWFKIYLTDWYQVWAPAA